MERVKNHQFVSMQVKNLTYVGRPAIAIYMRDVTKNVHEDLLTM